MSPALNSSATLSPSNSPTLKFKSPRYTMTTHTDFRIFEESLGLIASQSQSNHHTVDRNNYANLAKRVKVSGLSSGYTGVINKFRMSLPNIGFGYVDLRFTGPSRVILNHQYTKTGFLEIFYKANESGDYALSVRYLGEEISGSVFKIKVKQQECNPKAVVATGKGLKKVKAGERATFTVDTRKAGSGKLVVSIQSPSAEDNEIKAYVDATKIGYMVEYHPLCIGYHSVSVKYNDVHVLGSPFKAKISAVPNNSLPIEENAYFDGDAEMLMCSITNKVPNEIDSSASADTNEKKYRHKTFGMKLLRLPDIRKSLILH